MAGAREADGSGGGFAGVPDGGYYIQPTVFRGRNDMRVFQEEI